MRQTLTVALAVLLAASGCAHTSPGEMSAAEHRDEAALHVKAALQEEAQYDPKAMEMVTPTRTPFSNPPELALETYNVTEHHLRAAERHLAAAVEHREAARALERRATGPGATGW